MSPLVSIILSSYNQKERLIRAFESLLEQTYPSLEIIVVDDFSTDGSREQILNWHVLFPDKVKFYLQKKNLGIPKNKNTGFRMATGKYITFLDGDDFYMPEKVENELRFLESNPEYDVVYSNFLLIDEETQKQDLWAKDVMPEGFIFKDLLLESFPLHLIFRYEMCRSFVFRTYNYYDESLPIYEDWDFKLRYAAKHKVGYIPKIGSTYIRNKDGIVRRTNNYRLVKQHQRVVEKNVKENDITKDPDLSEFLQSYKRKHISSAIYGMKREDMMTILKAYALFLWYKPLDVKNLLRSVYYNLFIAKQ